MISKLIIYSICLLTLRNVGRKILISIDKAYVDISKYSLKNSFNIL